MVDTTLTIMKKSFLFRKTKFFSRKLLGIVILIFVFAFGGYCQSGKPRVDINRVYQSEVERLLLPGSQGTETSLIAAFLVHPTVDPDYSICLKDSDRQFFLELRLLDKNLNQELMTRFMQKQSLTLPLKANVYSTSVGKAFKKKMLKAFDSISISPIKKDPLLAEQYDGITYEFIWVKNGGMKKIPISFNIKAESYESGLIKLLSQISGDLKNNLFKGTKYFDKLK